MSAALEKELEEWKYPESCDIINMQAQIIAALKKEKKELEDKLKGGPHCTHPITCLNTAKQHIECFYCEAVLTE